MTAPTNVDIYDGHLLSTEWDGDDLYHEVIHPPTCQPVVPYPEEPSYIVHQCPQEFWASEVGDWDPIDSPGVRIIGWRHETYVCGYSTEHDLIVFVLPDAIKEATDG